MTLRLSPDMAEALEIVAAVDNMTLVAVVRVAITDFLQRRPSGSVAPTDGETK